MRRWPRAVVAIAAALSISAPSFAVAQTAPSPTALETPRVGSARPGVEAPAAVLLDMDSGQALFAKRPRERRPIASLTKIMTSMIVLESTDPGVRVTVSRNAASQLGAGVGLEPGERIAVRHLLLAALLVSANDAATALAEHVAGTVARFVDRMNRRSRQLGLADTRFFSPTGLDDRGYSTAEDVATLTTAAYAVPGFDRLVATREHHIPGSGEGRRELVNRNVLLWLFPGAAGVKTGSTSAAGHCISAVAKRDHRRLLAVVLGHPTHSFDDAATLFAYGFNGFGPRIALIEGQGVGDMGVAGGTIPAVTGRGVTLLVPFNPPGKVDVELVADGGIGLPVAEGDPVGRVVVRLNGRRMVSVQAVAAAAVEEDGTTPDGASRSGPFLRFMDMVAALIRAAARAFL